MIWPFDRRNHFQVANQLCVISGGSQGVGAEILKQLVLKDADVIVVARTESKLVQKVEELNALKVREDQVIKYIAADISEYDECTRVFADINPDIVVCCAGSAKPDLFTNLTGKDMELGIKANYCTALYFSHVAFNKMANYKTNDKKHIVFFSSVVAFFSYIGYAQYSPLKAAIRSLADTLKQEGLPYNIDVSCIFPGNFASEGYEEENLTKPEITKIIEGPSEAISCEKCCDIILRQLENGNRYITTDFIGYFLSSMMLGNSPRNWWFIQVLFSLILALVAPIWNIIINLQIMSFFNKGDLNKHD